MKIKYYAAVACIILHCIPSFGQRQQTTEAFNPFANGLPTTTQKTYSYIIGEDGKKLKDGTFAISGKPDVVVTTKNHTRYSVNNNGYYKLKTTFSKGKLHGAFTFSYSVTCTLQGLAGNGSESQSMTFNGEFSNGKPHGSFNIQYRTESNEKLVASYDNGVLVGSFSSNGYYKDVPCAVKGTLTPKGELTGKWVIDNKDTSFKEGIYEFQNGVLIRKTIDEWATIPAVTELSKKYAAGAITEEELSEQGIIVLEDSIPLGKYANNIIFNNDVLDLEMALGGGYDFSTLNNKRYKYLKEVSMFNEKGFEFYTQMLEENLNVGTFDSYIKNHDNYKWGKIRIEDEGLVVVDAYLDVCAPYINAKGLKEYDFETDIYLSKEQEKIWKEMRLEAKEQFAITFGTAVAKSQWLDHNLAEYFLHEDQTFSYHTYEEMRKEAVKRTNNNGVSEMLKYFMLVPDNHDYIVEKDDYGRGYHIFRCGDFIKKASLDRDTIMIYLLADKYDELVKGKSEEEKIKIEELKKELDAKLVNDLKKRVEPILEKMLNQSSTSIAYEEDAEEYFSPEDLPADYWRLEFSKKLKPFGKIIGYEIVDFHGEYYDEVECIITTSSKKKVQNKYKVIWKLDRREGRGVRIIANSIDINNAILVTAVNEKVDKEIVVATTERVSREEAERIAKEKAESEHLAKEEVERVAREEAERNAKEKAESERLAKEEAKRVAREEAERIAKEKAESERLAKEEAERVAREETERIAKEKTEAEKKAKSEAITSTEKQMVAETSSIIHEKVSKHVAPVKETKQTNYKQYVDLSLNSSYVGINYIGGYKLNQRLFLGIGAGVDFGVNPISDFYTPSTTIICGTAYHHNHEYIAEIGSSSISIPVYIDFRVNLSKNKWNPYISASVGYRLSTGNVNLSKHGEVGIADNIKPNFNSPILSVAYGVSKPVNDKCALFFSVALERILDNKEYELSTSCNGKSEYVDNISVSYTNGYYLAPTLSIGLSF